ncbi:MAG: DNA topoisomerase VI subunit B [Nitrososphaerales archaeon]
MSKRQTIFKEISPSEFFYRNRDLAGFSNPSRALYAATRELVENALDACETACILPDIFVRITSATIDGTLADPKPYTLKVQDNGPGVEPKYVPDAFARIFYGSKFQLKQSRGMFGMGATMAILYGQVTTNKPVLVTTSVDGEKAYTFEMMVNIHDNTPLVLNRTVKPANGKTGLSVQLTLEGDYSRSGSKIQEYFKQTALVTPYANILFIDPNGRLFFYSRATDKMPKPAKETLPHPLGIDIEALRRLLKESKEPTLKKFLSKNFHRVGDNIAEDFLKFAGLDAEADPKRLSNDEITRFVSALHSYKNFLPPDARCLSPLGEELLAAGIEKELQPEFLAVIQRPPSAYSGFPFIVEVGLAYGGKGVEQGLKLLRFANRIPLLYDEANDISWKVVNEEIDWKRYNIPQDAPLTIITHVCSTKVPYKTVGKEYLADRPELERELKNGVREVLRRLGTYLSRKNTLAFAKKKMNIYEKYLPLIARFSADLIGATKLPNYKKLLKKSVEETAENFEEPIVEVENKPIENKVVKLEQRRLEDFSQ